MSGVVIHTKEGCPFCDKSKAFFTKHNVAYTEVYYDSEAPDYEERKNVLLARTNHKTFPQIFIGETFLGGHSDLETSYQTLKLHDLLREIGVFMEYEF
jgi:glutaredoxin 3